MYGENLGTSTLSRSLIMLADDVYRGIDNGDPVGDYVDAAKSLMQGSMVLWEELVEWKAEEDA